MRYRAELSAVNSAARATAYTSLFIAVASVLGLVESVLLPPLPVPGMKLGLANMAVVLALVTLGAGRALVVSLARVFIVGLATGALGGPTMVLSLAGASCAWLAMWALSDETGRFSVIGLSVAGSAAHAVAQLVAAVFVTGSAAPLVLMPYSLMASLATGLIVGFLVHLIHSRLPLTALSIAR